MDLGVIGGGFVGVTTAVVFAEWGHGVHLVEVDPARREALGAGKVPFYEPGLQAALSRAIDSGRLRLASRLGEVGDCGAVFLCVGTPSLPDGSADLSQLRESVREVAEWGRSPLVVVKSTVPPGTSRDVVAPLLGKGIGVAMNPEFLQEGSALENARAPDRVVIGVDDEAASSALRDLYKDLGCPVLVCSTAAAELIKYASNAMLATRVAFANQMANLSQEVGVDVDEVMRGVGMDPRIGPRFLQAGPGFGGSCFPKDVKALRAVGMERGVRLGILDAVLANNESQPIEVVERLDALLGGLEGKRVALLGVAFKPGTSDVRETRALLIHEGLRAAGADVVCTDPRAGEAFQALVPEAVVTPSVQEALKGTHACVLHTQWPEYLELAPEVFLENMADPLVFDTRRELDAERLRGAGVRVYRLGDGTAAGE